MAFLFSRDRTLVRSRKDSISAVSDTIPSSRFSTSSSTAAATATLSIPSLPTPFGDLTPTLSPSDLRETAYEIFVAINRTSTGKVLTYNASVNSNSSLSLSNSSPRLQRSLTSTAASTMKKALGLKSKSSKKVETNSPGLGGRGKRHVTVCELMRVRMRVSEIWDSRIRRALLRMSAGQVGKRIDSMVIPLELLQQFKSSDFSNQEEYEKWQKRNLKVLEAGLLIHPLIPLDKSNAAAQRLRQIIHGAFVRPIETGRNNETMQVLRTTVMVLASRSSDGLLAACHWADGFPLNIRLYEALLQACFDVTNETSVLEGVEELMELIKKTWVILGLNQLLHNLCFTWVLFSRFVATGHAKNDLLIAADNQLAEEVKDSKTSRDPTYANILNYVLHSILGWAEKRLLAYHDTFDSGNIDSMQGVVSLGVTAAQVLVEDISNEYHHRRKDETDVAQSRIDTYIRSSLRTAFAQRMEKVDASRRASGNKSNSLPVLLILAKDVSELACKERETFSPTLKRWHPFAAGVAVATLHACYGSELRQFISGITELTPTDVQILVAADKLEKELVHVAVDDTVESDDGGKAIIREMLPYEAEGAITSLVKDWIQTRVDHLKECVDRNLQQEAWNVQANQEAYVPSAADVLRVIDGTLDAFFQLPIPSHPALLPELMIGLDRCIQYYVTKAKSGCGSRNTYVPIMPALTRCTTGKKLGLFKKKEKPVNFQRKNPQVATANGNDSFGIEQICVRINTYHKIRAGLDVLEKRVIKLLRNSVSAHVEDFSNGLVKNFELAPAACVEGIQQLCEMIAYKIVFHDLSNVLWNGLYIGEPASSRIQPFLQELERKLFVVAGTVHDRLHTCVIADIMRASFDGFLLVLLAGGPSRTFSRDDSKIIEEDFMSLKDFFWAYEDRIPADVINKFSGTVQDILPLFQTNTESLIDQFRRLTLEAHGNPAKSKLPLPPTSGQWNPTEPNTLLRVLCHRNDEVAAKFLKKTYNLPKKL